MREDFPSLSHRSHARAQAPQPSKRARTIQFYAVQISGLAECAEAVQTTGTAALIVVFGDE